jgi:SepF-like predicted cell division protein (DUF552 family)
VLDLRTELEEDRLIVSGTDPREALLDLEEELRDEYFAIEEALDNQRMDVRNTDGDPLSLHTLTYSIPSFERAFDALKDLELKLRRRTSEELLENAERNELGEPVKLYIHWLKAKKKNIMHDVITLATLTITGSTLIVDVNSARRSERVQKEIAKRLGGDAVLQKTEIMPHDALIRETSEKADGEEGESEHDRIMREVPEARAMMQASTEKHWAAWPDTSLPALRGMTPRQAVKDPIGRELLESLLMDFELRDKNQKDEFLRIDIAKLRRELGM